MTELEKWAEFLMFCAACILIVVLWGIILWVLEYIKWRKRFITKQMDQIIKSIREESE